MHNFNENWDGVRREGQVNEMFEWWNIALFTVIGILAAHRASEMIYMHAIDRLPKAMKDRISSMAKRGVHGKPVSPKEKADAVAMIRKSVEGMPNILPAERKRALDGLSNVKA